ncbi:MAG: DNA gyrase subunit A [Lachnospiraceae bacterium]|jgi:DNA gyrase subunit A|nr:DNA gyrase subunit A [Lachnospiraceae bacterium]MCH4063603.1 DNA gyrase subunit A [Lachnospiraceae bacterium]MCH4103674.1 DNA gyrase subunit A [Lachnospiraceae bacterium]
MDDTVFDKIQEVDLKKTMETSYIDYAMSVIVSRALPDVRDGLKPVQRRILWSMIELNNGPDKPHRKCARIVGDTMGKYHPHGDSSIYGALVNMAQEWSFHYPLVDGHGNFGSVDGDSPAAMRYTEARLSKISMEMLADINKDTVDFQPNFDETEKEPVVLPARIPNLLINGTTGIAVGMATNMPPHNLGEVIDACTLMINNQIDGGKDTSIEDIMKIIKGPDFPTGATILGRKGIEEAYRTGHGKIIVRAVSRIETKPNGKSEILVSELPFLVNKARLIESIADLVRNKKIDGITALNDHSSREGMEICIEVRRDANPNVILNQLYKHTQLQDTFGVNNLALVDGQPKVLNLKELLVCWLRHQEDVVRRRTRFDLNKAEERAHILKGLLIALDHIDEVIRIIRNSANVQEAKKELTARFDMDDVQAQAIVDMRLRALTGLERSKIENEYAELMKKIDELKKILADQNRLLAVIRDEMLQIKEKYADPRKTEIIFDSSDISIEDMVPDENTVITATQLGYIKRTSIENFRSQNRGGKGIKGMQTIENDMVVDVMMTSNHNTIFFFTNFGRVYRLKAYEIPEASRTSRGTALINLLQLQPGEHVTNVMPIRNLDEDKQLIMATKRGIVKKTPLADFKNMRKTGLAAINLTDGDELIEVKWDENESDILLVTRKGMSIRFNLSDVRPMGRSARGVIGMKLADGDEVVSMMTENQGSHVLFISENGMGKLTPMTEFKTQHRDGSGVKCYKITEKSGELVGARAVCEDDDVLLITTEGIVMRTPCSSISVLGRITTGVKVMDLKDGVKVASFSKVKRDPEESNEDSDTE